MAHYLIIGRSGTGKSTICRELQARGVSAFDGDKVPGMARWIDLSNNQPIEADYPGDDHIGKFDWDWDEQILADLLKNNQHMFLCGNADNALEFYPLFDKVFILDLPPESQRQRIMARVEHDYGKDPMVQDHVIKAQGDLLANAKALGAIPIDASPSATIIVDLILEKIATK